MTSTSIAARAQETLISPAESNRPPVIESSVKPPATPPPPRAEAIPSRETDDLNRRLWAGAYCYEWFRTHVLQTVLEDNFRALGPSGEIDLESLVGHCLKARALRRKRDFIMMALAVGQLPIFILGAAAGSPGVLFLLLLACLGASVWISCRYLWETEVEIVAQHLSKASFRRDLQGQRLSDFEKRRVQAALASQAGNVVVFGGFSPFVGSGEDHGGWSFAVNLKPAEDASGAMESLTPFAADELYASVESAICALGIKGLSVDDKLYVHGSDLCLIEGHQLSHHDRPQLNFDHDTFERIRLAGNDPVLRYYKGFRMVGWQGEVTFSAFVRFQLSPGTLFIETSYHLLPPLSEWFYKADALLPSPSIPTRLLLFIRGAARAVAMQFLWWFFALVWFSQWSQRNTVRKQEQRQLRESYNFNRGPQTTIREYAMARIYRRYFQKQDKEFVHKIFDKTLLDTIVSFLEDRGYETSDLRERQNVILNNGVIVSGGNLQAESLTVGQQARTLVGRVLGGTAKAAPASNKH